MVGQITSALAARNINISNMINKSKGNYAYTIIDIDSEICSDTLDKFSQIPGVIRVRAI